MAYKYKVFVGELKTVVELSNPFSSVETEFVENYATEDAEIHELYKSMIKYRTDESINSNTRLEESIKMMKIIEDKSGVNRMIFAKDGVINCRLLKGVHAQITVYEHSKNELLYSQIVRDREPYAYIKMTDYTNDEFKNRKIDIQVNTMNIVDPIFMVYRSDVTAKSVVYTKNSVTLNIPKSFTGKIMYHSIPEPNIVMNIDYDMDRNCKPANYNPVVFDDEEDDELMDDLLLNNLKQNL